MPVKNTLRLAAAVCCAAVIVACGDRPEPESTADEARTPVELPRTSSPPGASVFFITPANGATVSSPFPVKFGISGMAVAPAGEPLPASGHHHLIIDTTLERYDLPVPKTDQHRHFGGGQTETLLELPPGEHTLQLVLGDANHVPHEPPVKSSVITIRVE